MSRSFQRREGAVLGSGPELVELYWGPVALVEEGPLQLLVLCAALVSRALG